jgi:putative flippase GtrA
MFLRWLRFSAVGIAGAGVQLGVLWWCTNAMRIAEVPSIAIAVSSAVLHNFFWHEAWTWKKMPAAGRLGRLGRFYLSNGVASLVANTVLTMFFRQFFGLIASNFLAIALTALLNFILADRWVFRRAGVS